MKIQLAQLLSHLFCLTSGMSAFCGVRVPWGSARSESMLNQNHSRSRLEQAVGGDQRQCLFPYCWELDQVPDLDKMTLGVVNKQVDVINAVFAEAKIKFHRQRRQTLFTITWNFRRCLEEGLYDGLG
ncbi:hypothetical protein HIM_04217 [Hirsutella minnesotensis 3608]|uniref:Uncharacterized protein n=1 Tax=Hirsutella minnesotensis 3608 TaxID=1043627 RepID=A0A0F7ZVE8_9HYPO|nr:hypothetical protein HIM_04217 [Hirsutella minnesotensis 3608]